ncbi:MAG: glycosyltransferase family 4 protein [Terriglobales bacterium]
MLSKYSGIETYYEEVGKRLVKSGHDVTVYCRTYFTPKLAEHHGMRLVRLPTIRSKHLDTLVHTLLSTVHAVFSCGDVVHYHASGSAMFSFLHSDVWEKTVVSVQGLDWKRKKWGKVASSILQFAEGRAAAFPNATIVVSRILQQHYRTQGSRGTICIPNGTSVRETMTSRRLSAWGLKADSYILFLGRFSPEKNCHLLIEAYKKLGDTPVKLVLAGGSSYSDACAEKVRAEQSNHIRVLDWLSGEALDELITNAMLFVLPSDIEGLSLSLLDAMGAGVCVLTSDIPENLEVTDGVGYSFRRGNASDLARMLALLISNPAMPHAAAEGALKRVEQQYLWDNITSRIEKVYRGLLLGQQPGALPFFPKIRNAKHAA